MALFSPHCRTRGRAGALGIGAICFGLLVASLSRANDDQRFYERLLEEGHGQLAAELLVRAESDPLVSEAFRSTARYKQLELDIAKARATPNAARRTELLALVAKQLDSIGARLEGPEAVAYVRATGSLASAITDEARRDALDARRLPEGAARNRRLQAARTALGQAEKRLATAATGYEQEHKKLRGVQPQSAEGRLRLDLLGRLAQTRLIGARLRHDRAMTYPTDSDPYQKLNREAAEQLSALYEKYSKWIVGLYAHLYEGVCYRALGETALAAGCFEDLVSQPTSTAELHRLVTHAQAELAALWVDAGDPAKALLGPREALRQLGNGDRAESAMLRYHLGRAQIALAEALPEGSSERRSALREAGDWLAESAAVPSEVRSEAREAWTRVATLRGKNRLEPKDFDEAYQAGKRALDTLASTQVASAVADSNAAEQLQAQAEAARTEARHALKAAIGLADAKTPAEQLNEARYLLAWIAWDTGQLQHTAKMAEFLVRVRPTDAWAERGALLGLVALQRLQQESSDKSEPLRKRLLAIAQKSIVQWPEGETASAAISVLLGDALRRGQIEEAERLVKGLSDQQRPLQALRLATIRWEGLLAKPNAADRDRIYRALIEAMEQVKRQGMTPAPTPLLTATLHAAREQLDRGDATKAITLLTNIDHGPYAFLKRGDPPADEGRFAVLTAQTAARAYVLSGDTAFTGALDLLDATLAKQPLTEQLRARLALAVQLMAKLDNSVPEVQSRTAGALDRLLSMAREHPDATDWNKRTWIAQTYYRLAELPGRGDEAEAYLREASEVFGALVESAEVDPQFAPSQTALLAAQLQAAQCDRRLGRYREALASFESLLAERPALLEVQTAAAQSLQAWGIAERQAEHLEAAIAGSRPDPKGKNAVWGWRKVAAVASRASSSDKKYEQLFYDAWLEVAQCRYLVGTLTSDAERKDHFRKAANTLRAMQRQYPGLGGKEMQQEYAALLQKVQAASTR